MLQTEQKLFYNKNAASDGTWVEIPNDVYSPDCIVHIRYNKNLLKGGSVLRGSESLKIHTSIYSLKAVTAKLLLNHVLQ